MTSLCSVSNLSVGERLSATVYYTVLEINPNNVKVIDENGQTLTISNGVLERECYSANQFTEEAKVSRTDICKTIQGAGDTIFEAVFKKKDGTQRTMVARKVPYSDQTIFGRTEVYEMAATGAKPQKRQIDHRTIEQLTLKNKRFRVK